MFPVLAVYIFVRCIIPLLQEKKNSTVWGYLYMGGTKIPLEHWENSLGRSKLSDIVINLPFVSKNHAVLAFRRGTWTVTDLNSKNGVEVNGVRIEKQQAVKHGDTISLGGLKTVLLLPGGEPGGKPVKIGTGKNILTAAYFNPGITFFLVLLFQILGCIQVCLSMGAEIIPAVPLTFFLFILAQSTHFIFLRWRSRKYLELELLCYFLCGISLLVLASTAPGFLFIQLTAVLMGMAVYNILNVLLRDLERAKILRYLLVGSALVLLALTLILGETRFGATRWINLGFISFQPSEFIKVAFIMAGTATLDRLLTTRNMTGFILFTGSCIGALIFMRDFGTLAVFFGTFIVIAFMRSGDIRTAVLTTSGGLLGTVTVISFMPYIASRFAAWGNVWEYADTIGYQQTRTLIAAASGGFLGVGGGNGHLAGVAAADTDLVFGVLCEEWGLLVALTVVLIIVFLAFFAVFLTRNCLSSFYAIAACGAGTMFLIQAALSVLGSVDILPLTGVTIPFISRGGSSMVASWALLAFIKSADDRRRPSKRIIYAKKRRAV